MAKRRKIKKSTLLVGGIIGFFVIYFITFKVFSMMESSKNNPVKVQTEVDNRSLLRQLKGKDKIYLSDDKVADVRVEAELLEELRYSFEDDNKEDKYVELLDNHAIMRKRKDVMPWLPKEEDPRRDPPRP